MISYLNRKMRGFLLIILVLVAVSFIFFVDFAPSAAFGPRNLGEIKGKSVTRTDFQSYLRETEISFTLTTGQMLSSFPGMEEMILGETWNRLITLKAAEEAGIEVTAGEISDFITAHPLFQENGVYSPQRFRQFANSVFDPPGVQISDGMNLEKFEKTVRHQIMIEKFNDLLQSPATATPEDVEDYLVRLHGSASIRVAKLSRDQISRSLNVEEDELKSFYQQNINSYQTSQKRQVQYVEFKLDPSIGDDPAERKAAMRRLGEQAFQFSDPFYQAQQEQTTMPDFSAQAGSAGLTIRETGYFSAEAPPENIAEDSPFASIAFTLTPENPVSDAVEMPDGYVVLSLKDIRPSEPIPFEEVKAEVRAAFRDQEINRQLRIRGQEAYSLINEQLKSGTSWEEAVQSAGLQSAPTLTIVPAELDRNSSELSQTAARAAANLKPGSLSSFRPVSDGGALFYLESRTPPSEEILEANREAARFQLTARQGASLVREWVQSQYTAPGTEIPMTNETPGS